MRPYYLSLFLCQPQHCYDLLKIFTMLFPEFTCEPAIALQDNVEDSNIFQNWHTASNCTFVDSICKICSES